MLARFDLEYFYLMEKSIFWKMIGIKEFNL
jgi:hypothetical protein